MGRLVGLEAPSGAGKSTLMDQLAADHEGPALEIALSGPSASRSQLLSRLERSVRRHGLSDLLAAIGRNDERDPLGTLLRWADRHAERLLVLIDDVHLGDDELGQFIADLADDWPRPHKLVIAGRRLPDPVRRCLVGTDRVLIGPGELRFRSQEVRELLDPTVLELLEADDVDLITSACDGWAAAVDLTANRLHRAALDRDVATLRDAVVRTRPPATVADLLDALLRASSVVLRTALAQLCLLPVVDDDLARLAGIHGGMTEIADLGIPLDASGLGTWTFPAVVREALRPAERDERFSREAAQWYVAGGRLEAALEVLRAARLDEDLADLLADLPPALIGQLDAVDHADAVAVLPHHCLVTRPRILLHLADSYLLSGRAEAYAQTVGRAVGLLGERTVGGAEPDPKALEVHAVALTVQVVASNDDRLVGTAQQLLDGPDLPSMSRARLRAAVGRAIATRRTTPALREAAREIAAAARSFEREGATVHAAATDVIAATFASIPLGRYDVALDQLDRALASSPSDPIVRVAVLPYRAFVLVALGRYAEAEAVLAELRRTATTTGQLGNERSAAFARWATARMASQQGDAETTWAACRAVERADVAVDTGDGAHFRADAAQLLARVGWFDEAERLLADARGRDPGGSAQVDFGAYAVAAYAGDEVRALELLERLGGDALEPRARWRVTLLHAYVCHRAGDTSARRLAAAAFEEAAQLGYPDLPLVQEPVVARELLPLAREGSASARDAVVASGARIRLFGRFEVERAGQLSEPAGRPAELIAYLALHDRQAGTERIIEALWPDSDPERGRERLRTVLRRVRRDHGDLVERAEGLLRLGEQVSVDVEEFLRFCRGTADPSTDREQAASAALAIHRGEPAPGLAHLDWVSACRRHLEERALAMHDVVADATTRDGRLDDAIRALLAALVLDPLAEHRYLAAARLLAEQGRRARAFQVLDEGRNALIDAGLEPSREFHLLDGYLSRNPAVAARAS